MTRYLKTKNNTENTVIKHSMQNEVSLLGQQDTGF